MLGIDSVEIKRIKKLLNNKNIENVFSKQEIENIFKHPQPAQRAAGYFAVKEAVLKALQLGIYNGLALNEICVEYNINGAPVLAKNPNLERIITSQGFTRVQISITHTSTTATAICFMQ